MSSYEQYKSKIAPLCPVAIRIGQANVHAPGHNNWGIVTCGCGEKFGIGYNMIYGARITDKQAYEQLLGLLASDHQLNNPHQDSYELQD